jgi:hypothetical protein
MAEDGTIYNVSKLEAGRELKAEDIDREVEIHNKEGR